MTGLRTAINEHPLTAFAVLTYALSWWSAPFRHGAIIAYGPFAAALIVFALTGGRPGTRGLFRRMTSWRGGWSWLLVGPGLVIAYLLSALAANLVLGGTFRGTLGLGSIGASSLRLLFGGGQWEEPGWSGFALPFLQQRYANRPHGFLLAALHVGMIRTIWHLPLVLYGDIPWYDGLVFTMAFQLMIAWLFNCTGGSVLIPMLFHLTSNVIGGGLLVPVFTGADHVRFAALSVAAGWLAATILVWTNLWSTGRPSESIQGTFAAQPSVPGSDPRE